MYLGDPKADMQQIALRDLRKLLKMRREFPWVPGILGEYMRNKCHRDIRLHIRTVRVLREKIL